MLLTMVTHQSTTDVYLLSMADTMHMDMENTWGSMVTISRGMVGLDTVDLDTVDGMDLEGYSENGTLRLMHSHIHKSEH